MKNITYFVINNITKIIKYTSQIVLGLITLCSLPSCNDSLLALKQRIEKADMAEYIDTFYEAKLLYPDFFKVDSVGKCYASFSYSDKNVKELRLTYCKYPPKIVW